MTRGDTRGFTGGNRGTRCGIVGTMGDLLDRVVRAHGGIERWERVSLGLDDEGLLRRLD